MGTQQQRARARRQTAAAGLAEHWQVLDTLEAERQATRHVRADALRALDTTLPTRPFLKAATVWMGATFALCYVALPVAFEAIGLREAQLWALPGELVGLLGVWLGALVMTARRHVRGEGVRVDLAHLAESDRLPAAALGGLMTWGLLHNVLPGLVPLGDMPLAWLTAFLASNVVENVLFGVVAASLADSRRGAFALGALTQLVLLGLAWML